MFIALYYTAIYLSPNSKGDENHQSKYLHLEIHYCSNPLQTWLKTLIYETHTSWEMYLKTDANDPSVSHPISPFNPT